jgi:LCP family protein required for cell wall assembly
MANGRPSDGRSSRSSRNARSQPANASGLESLGQQMRGGARPGALANEAGLQSLGAKIDASKSRGGGRGGGSGGSGGGGNSGRGGGNSGRGGGKKPRRSAGRRVLRVGLALLALLVLVAAGGYGYFRYEWGRIQTAACASCASVADGDPYNVLLIGSDTRAGETAAEAQQFGTQATAGGQRSDTIKIIHVDPKSGTASVLSLPRDTFVTLSGVPKSSGVSNPNKLNAAFASGSNDKDPTGTGANGLVQTIQNTLGIPISHWIVVNFFGLTDAVTALGGVMMDFPYPVQDYGPCNGPGTPDQNCTGLSVQTTGCQLVTGPLALALSRSRHFEWYQNGAWHSDFSGDIGRIERQDLIIEAVVNKAKSTYNPITAASFISSLTHDVTLDNKLSATTLLDLGERYHAFSGSSLTTYTLPTAPGTYAPYGNESVVTVQEPAATTMITQFLQGAPNASTTPPLDQNGNPQSTAAATGSSGTSGATGNTGAAATTAPPSTGSATTTPSTSTATSKIPYYDPRPC